MRLLLMRYFLFSALCLSSCVSDYALLKTGDAGACPPGFSYKGLSTSWYDASVDVLGKHISGILLIKPTPDGACHTVFMNEAGVTFFNFEWDSTGRFTSRHIIPQLDKKPVILTLRKDFELLLGIPFRKATPTVSTTDNEVYFGVSQKKETAYFITGKDCASLHRLELGSKRKRKTSIALYGPSLQTPDSIVLQHHTFAMRIVLKKLQKE